MSHAYQPGDILFGNLDCNEGAAIRASTQSPYTHVGMIVFQDRNTCVIEAHEFVKLTPLQAWLDKCQHHIAHARVLSEYETVAQKASRVAFQFLGHPYSYTYELSLKELYCASLIYFSFKMANHEQDFFELKPMNFKDAWDAWQKYFGARKIPQGKPGLSPASIYQSKKIKILSSLANISAS